MIRSSYHKLGVWLAWAGAWLPALLVLIWITPLRVGVPHADAWAYVPEYVQWHEGTYDWKDFFKPHNQHQSAVGKIIYFAVMEWADGDVALLPLLSWLFTVIIALSVCFLSRSLWAGRPLIGAGITFLANLAIFTLAQSESWVWDFIYQNFIGGVGLVTALAAIRSGWSWTVKLPLTLIPVLLASFSFSTGFLTAFLILPVLFMESRNLATTRRYVLLAAALLTAVALAYLILVALAPPSAGNGISGRVSDLLKAPLMTVQYILILLGLPFAYGTSIEPELQSMMAGIIMLTLLALSLWHLIKDKDRQRWYLALPWLVLCAWSFLGACLICLGRMDRTLSTALASRYVTFTVFFSIGILMLTVLTWSRIRKYRFLPRHTLPVALTLLVACHGLNWLNGARAVKIFSMLMKQKLAMLEFANVLKPVELGLWTLHGPGYTLSLEWAKQLEKIDRLREVKFVESLDVSQFRKLSEISSIRGQWSLSKLAHNGRWRAEGFCMLSRNPVEIPDLIVLTAQVPGGEEILIDTTPPNLASELYDRILSRAQFPEHFYGWSCDLEPSRLPQNTDVTVRAYGFTLERRRLIPLQGAYSTAGPAN